VCTPCSEREREREGERERKSERKRERGREREIEREREREGKREKEGERALHARASRKCGRALSIPHSFIQSVSMRDYIIYNIKGKKSY
jgi:hypothetical protein